MAKVELYDGLIEIKAGKYSRGLPKDLRQPGKRVIRRLIESGRDIALTTGYDLVGDKEDVALLNVTRYRGNFDKMVELVGRLVGLAASADDPLRFLSKVEVRSHLLGTVGLAHFLSQGSLPATLPDLERILEEVERGEEAILDSRETYGRRVGEALDRKRDVPPRNYFSSRPNHPSEDSL
jgi:hypothetical protein